MTFRISTEILRKILYISGVVALISFAIACVVATYIVYSAWSKVESHQSEYSRDYIYSWCDYDVNASKTYIYVESYYRKKIFVKCIDLENNRSIVLGTMNYQDEDICIFDGKVIRYAIEIKVGNETRIRKFVCNDVLKVYPVYYEKRVVE